MTVRAAVIVTLIVGVIVTVIARVGGSMAG